MATGAIKAGAALEAPQARIDYTTLLSGRAKALILAGVLLGLFLSALDQTIVSTALPRIVADLQGIDLLAWVSTSYLLASTTMVPIYGKLSDIFGRKAVLITGIVIFLAGSVLCGFAPTMLSLVIFRGIQGLGAAALTSTAFAVPADLFVPSERARYQGLFAAVFALSSVIGPYLGGLITDSVGWHWTFFVNLPLGLLALGFIVTKMPRLNSGLRSTIDYAGAVLLVVAVVPLLLALSLDKHAHAWNSPLILGLFALALAGSVGFFLVERRASSPIIPLELFRNRTFALIIPIAMLVGAALFASILFLSIYLVNVQGVSATDAGTALIPMMMGLAIGSLVSGQLVQRLGRYKFLVLFGLAIMAVGFWMLTTLDVNSSLNTVRLYTALLGIGMGPSMPVLNLALQNAVPHDRVGIATAGRQFFMQLGQVIGTAIFGVVLTTSLTSTLSANLAPVLAQAPADVAAQVNVDALRNGHGGGEGVAASAHPLPAELSPATPLGRQFDAAVKQSFSDSVTRIYGYTIPLVLLAFVLALFVPELPLRASNRDHAPVVE
jgi:EmrB/QacA subfamily drug resistance transporter